MGDIVHVGIAITIAITHTYNPQQLLSRRICHYVPGFQSTMKDKLLTYSRRNRNRNEKLITVLDLLQFIIANTPSQIQKKFLHKFSAIPALPHKKLIDFSCTASININRDFLSLKSLANLKNKI